MELLWRNLYGGAERIRSRRVGEHPPASRGAIFRAFCEHRRVSGNQAARQARATAIEVVARLSEPPKSLRRTCNRRRRNRQGSQSDPGDSGGWSRAWHRRALPQPIREGEPPTKPVLQWLANIRSDWRLTSVRLCDCWLCFQFHGLVSARSSPTRRPALTAATTTSTSQHFVVDDRNLTER